VLKKADKDGAHSAAIDCIRWLPNHRAATKSVDGRLFVWDTTTWERVVAIKVPGCPPGCEPSLFGMTPSGDFLVAGNASGDTFVYDAATGTRVVQLKVPPTHPTACRPLCVRLSRLPFLSPCRGPSPAAVYAHGGFARVA
jgi:WD40 repeat protein